jgi:hypothetical protein
VDRGIDSIKLGRASNYLKHAIVAWSTYLGKFFYTRLCSESMLNHIIKFLIIR